MMTAEHDHLWRVYNEHDTYCVYCGRSPLPWWARLHQRYLIWRYCR